MTAKEYLRQVKRINLIVISISEQIARLESLAVSTGHPLEPSGPAYRDPSKSSRTESIALQLVEQRDRKVTERARLLRIKENVESSIHALNNLTYEYILEERYLNNKTFDQIADQMSLSKDYVLRLHREALHLIKVV